MRKYLIACTILLPFIFLTNCKKDEDTTDLPKAADSAFYFADVNYSVEELLEKSHLTLRAWFGKNVGFTFSDFATDIYTWGIDNRTVSLYDLNDWSLFDHINDAIRRELDRGILYCEKTIEKADSSDTDYTQEIAEAKFLHALYSSLVVETWGDDDISGVYTQVFNDLDDAADNLPSAHSSNIELSANTAIALRARMNLTRGNYTEALADAKQIIEGGTFTLDNDFENLWDIENRDNSETIYAVDNTNPDDPLNTFYEAFVYLNDNNTSGLELREGGHQAHLMYEIRYEKMGGMTRDMENGRGFLRYRPTKFLIDLFNETLDERFNASFKNVWYSNDSTLIPEWENEMIINDVTVPVDSAKIGKKMFSLGDTAALFYKGVYPGNRAYCTNINYGLPIHPEKGYVILDLTDMYSYDYSINGRMFYFPLTKKFQDLTRLDALQQYSSRNAYIIRIAEMYLIAAEAAMENGDAGTAYNYLKLLADARSYSGNGTALLSAYGINSGSDIDIDFILNERAREFAGEQFRWFDLKRTGKLIERVQAFNPDDGHLINPTFTLRPIPDYLLSQGYSQNPGY